MSTALAWAAGFVHALASVDHFDHYWLYGAFFAVLAVAQFSWGVALYRRPARRLLVAGAAGSLGIVLLWAFTRIIGPPIGPDAWTPEAVGVPDLVATLTQGLLAAIAFILLQREQAPYIDGRGAAAARALAYPLLIVAVLAAFMGGHAH